MSLVDRILGSVKDLVVMRDDLARLSANQDVTNADVRDHERRLIRIETMIEMNDKAARRQLPG